MIQRQTRDLFQLQIELVDQKVEIAVGKSVDRIIDHIAALRTEVHDGLAALRIEMRDQISGLRTEMHDINIRLAAVETKLGMRSEARSEIHKRLLYYLFKALWLGLPFLVYAGLLYFHLKN